MNIWYIHPYAGGPGVGRYWRPFYLCKAWLQQGHSAIVITSSFHHLMDTHTENKASVNGVPYYYVGTTRYKSNGFGRLFSMLLFAMRLLFKGIVIARENKPDLIIYSSAHPFGYLSAWLLSKIYKCTIYFEVRDIWPLSLVEVAKVSRFHPLVLVIGCIERFAYRTASIIISLLPGARNHMISKGMLANKFLYIPNGFSKELVRTTAGQKGEEILDDVRRYQSEGYFLYVYAGALGEPNAMHQFLDCLPYLNATINERCKFIIIGKGEQAESLMQRCTEEGYTNVVFYGQIGKSIVLDVLEYMDAAFFVMHSLPIYKYGVSLNKLFDYMSSALPVIAAFEAFNDPVTDANCGIRIMPNNPQQLAMAFEALFSMSEDELSVLGNNGSSYISQEHEYSNLARKIISQYEVGVSK